MKTYIYKYFYLLISSFALLSIIICWYIQFNSTEQASATPVSFTLESAAFSAELSLYQADSNHYYLFLPSYAHMKQVQIHMSALTTVYIDSIEMKDSTSLDNFQTDKEYSFSINAGRDMKIQFCQSSDIPTMHIDTISGTMQNVHEDKEYKELVYINLISPNGNIIFKDDDARIEGRGSSSWGLEKKPYSLTLSSENSLLNMSPSTDWILLANAKDETNLRNKIIYDLTRSLPYNWAPQCQYVDVYLNGSYNGLYLLAEKIQVSDNHLNIDTLHGDFLCKVDLPDREDSMRNPFQSTHGRIIEITSPKTSVSNDISRIHSLVNEMEESILFTPSDTWPDNLDLDSFVAKYLVDEISANGDADLASSYFYYENGTFYGGPIWDYDSTFGNSIRNQNPLSFTANKYCKATYYRSPYYDSLYHNDIFYNRVADMYTDDFLPLIEQLLDNGIDRMADDISSAAKMNSIRWRSMFDESTSYVTTVPALKEYLESHSEFLSSAWIDNIDYCTVHIERGPKSFYYSIAIPRGEYLDASCLEADEDILYHIDTGETFDISAPITEDIFLTQNKE